MRYLPLVALLALAACQAVNPVVEQSLTAAGDKAAAQHVADMNALGQLACRTASGAWVLPVGANVVGATAKAVAQVCDAAAPGSLPGALPSASVAKIVSVGNQVLDVLAASKVLGG